MNSVNDSANTFMSKLRRGEVTVDDADKYIEEWHHSHSWSSITDYLGMSPHEYELFVCSPAVFKKIYGEPNVF